MEETFCTHPQPPRVFCDCRETPGCNGKCVSFSTCLHGSNKLVLVKLWQKWFELTVLQAPFSCLISWDCVFHAHLLIALMSSLNTFLKTAQCYLLQSVSVFWEKGMVLWPFYERSICVLQLMPVRLCSRASIHVCVFPSCLSAPPIELDLKASHSTCSRTTCMQNVMNTMTWYYSILAHRTNNAHTGTC